MQLRMTNQREIILRELLKSKKHLTADELYDIVKKDMPRISLATVYRNLEILSEAGLIGKLEISGRQKRFDYDVSDHDHIYCAVCHRVDNLNIERESLNVERLGAAAGYSITGCRLEIIGICPDCQKKENSKEKK
ncbi:MAG: Fur family transcriptional regulator [Desulforhopalus sp.]